jgi:predicted RNase H-like nuclease (RuvC/YqgF family)
LKSYEELWIEQKQRVRDLEERIRKVDGENFQLKENASRLISKTEAEAERRRAALAMQAKAATLAQGPGGEPTELSEAILDLEPIKSKWSI